MKSLAVAKLTVLAGLFVFCMGMVPNLCAQGLEEEIRALNEKYGADSVARTVARLNHSAAAAAEVAPGVDTSDAVRRENAKRRFGGFLIRRSYTDVTSDEDPSVGMTGSKGTRPAEFAYSHDFQGDNDQWSVHVAVIRPFEIWNGKPLTGIFSPTQFVLVPSVGIDRVNSTDPTVKEVDSIAFRLGLFSQFTGGPPGLRLFEARAFGTYQTTSHFGGSIVAGEFDLEPTTDLPGDHRYTRIISNGTANQKVEGSLIEAKWRVYLHGEVGDAFGRQMSKGGNDNFFRLGPVAELSLDPFFHPRLNANIHYAFLAGINGSPSESHNFTIGLNWVLDSEKIWTLSATYEDGVTPIVDQAVQSFALSIGVKL
jgi:hypothetical protein